MIDAGEVAGLHPDRYDGKNKMQLDSSRSVVARRSDRLGCVSGIVRCSKTTTARDRQTDTLLDLFAIATHALTHTPSCKSCRLGDSTP